MNKNKKIFIITITFLMLIGLTTITATNIDTNDTTTITDTTQPTIDTTKTETRETNTLNYDTVSTNEASSSQTDNIQENTDSQGTLNNKTEEKTQNLKADRNVIVNSYTELNSYLTNNNYDTVTIEIDKDIQLAGNILVNTAIKTLTINGNQKIINGMGQYQFLQIPTATTVIIDNIIITNCTTTRNGGAIAGQKDSIITYRIVP